MSRSTLNILENMRIMQKYLESLEYGQMCWHGRHLSWTLRNMPERCRIFISGYIKEVCKTECDRDFLRCLKRSEHLLSFIVFVRPSFVMEPRDILLIRTFRGLKITSRSHFVEVPYMAFWIFSINSCANILGSIGTLNR